jgi:O-antigen/teichoic acid export membrane protein
MKSADSTMRRLSLLPRRLLDRLQGREQVRAMVANSGWLIFDKLARALLGLLVGAWVARYLGPSEYGLLAYVLAYVALFQAVASLGADSIIVRDIAQRPDAAASTLATALALRFALGVACWVGVVITVALTSGGDTGVMVLAALAGGVLVFQAGDVVDLWFQSRSQSRRTVLAKLTTYLLSSGVKIALILHQAPLAAFALVITLEAAGSAFALWIAYRRLPTAHPWKASASSARALLKEAWPLTLSGVAIMVYMRVDQIMIQQMLGPRELGLYAAILPISQFWQLLPLSIAVSLAPAFARLRASDPEKYVASMVQAFRAFFYAGVACAVLTAAVSALVVELLFGSTYRDSARVLAIHSFSNVFLFLGVAHGLWLTNERRVAVRLWGTLAAGLCTVGLNFALLPRLGLSGAAWASILAQSVAAFLINALLDRRSFRLQLDAILWRRR